MTLTRVQIQALATNIDKLLLVSLPELAKRGRIQDLIKLLETDKRFRFIDQVPGAVEKIQKALKAYGVNWP